MTTSDNVHVSRFANDAWVIVEFNGKDVQFYLVNNEDVNDKKVKDIVGMAFSICSNIEQIKQHCKLNGVLVELDEIF